jgi:RsiW-degrading membrane proteinase PrsW (M82 family)
LAGKVLSLSRFLPSFEAEVLVIAVLAPLIEESAKAYPLFYRHGESQKSSWTMGLLVGFGFAGKVLSNQPY